MSNLTSVTVTAGIPTAGTGTVSTIDALLAALLAGTTVLGASEAHLGSIGGTTVTPTDVFTRPAANSTTAGSVTVGSFTASRIATGSGLIIGGKLISNHTTGLSGVAFEVDLWTAAPTFTNGDNGAYAVATSGAGANRIGTLTGQFDQYADGASAALGVKTKTNLPFKLASGSTVYWTLKVLSAFTPQSGKTFTFSPDLIQD